MKRISRDYMYMEISRTLSLRSTCSRARVGALLVRDGRVVATGYSGAPSGMPHCTEVGCLIGPHGGCDRTVHAEANVIAFAARHGISSEGSTLYVTLSPCTQCAKLIINAGITHVVYDEEYRDKSGIHLLESAGVVVRPFHESDTLIH